MNALEFHCIQGHEAIGECFEYRLASHLFELLHTSAVASRQIEGLIGSQVSPVTRRLPGAGPLVYGRGVQCELSVDEDAFSGTSPYLMGLVLEHYLARHVSINVFTQTRLQSMQRGLVADWPVRMGTRGVV